MSQLARMQRATGQPYTVKIGRQLADHTMLEILFVEPDDVRVQERTKLVLELLDERMIATNEKIMGSADMIEEQVKARIAKLNGGADAGSDRTTHVPADS